MKKEPYACICCGYTTHLKNDMKRHLYIGKKPCPKILNDIELTDEIKDYILTNRVYHINIKNTSLIDKLKNMEIEINHWKNNKNEQFYQLIVEKYLGHTHKRITCGITDITTETIHAEIKRWNNFKEAIGQLTTYNIVDPKEENHV